MKRFLVKHVGNMGDMIFFVPPVLATLKKKHPGCHITFVTAWGFKEKGFSLSERKRVEGWGKRNQSGFSISLMMTNPDIDQLIHWHDKKLSLDGRICREAGQSFPTWNTTYFKEQAESGPYDGVFELDFGLTSDDNPITKIYEALGLPEEDYSDYQVYLTDSDQAVAKAVIGDAPHPRIILLEGLSGPATRNWDPGKVKQLETSIEQRYGVPPIWFGGKYNHEYQGRPLTLRENIATLTFCDVGIGVLSGALHFAAAAKLPTLTLYSDHAIHRAAPAFFLNRYINDPSKQHRTLLGPSHQPMLMLKGDVPSTNLTPAEKSTQHFKYWSLPGRQSTKSPLAVITVDEVMLVLEDMIKPL